MALRVITSVILERASLNSGSGKISGAFFGTLYMGLVVKYIILDSSLLLLFGSIFKVKKNEFRL
jgi:ribose/xylose/arabinose/galactoside ABC-type transport system permease subunit